MKYRPLVICLSIVSATILIINLIQNSRASSTSFPEKNTTSSVDLSPVDKNSKSITDRELESNDQDTVSGETKYWERQPKPFQVTKSSERFEWTKQDCLSPEAIKVLANNPYMVEALTESAKWTKRRQLVYLKPGFNEKAQKIYQQELKEIVLPGFDGEEFRVKIDMVTDFGELLSGSFTGDVVGEDRAEVVAGSDKNYWSIGLQFQDRHYQIENRELGEWVVSEIDVAAMNAHFGACEVERTVDDVGTPHISK